MFKREGSFVENAVVFHNYRQQCHDGFQDHELQCPTVTDLQKDPIDRPWFAHAIEGKHVVDCLMVLVHVCQNSIHSGGVIVGQVSVHEGQKHVKDVGFVTVSKCIDVDGGMYVAERQPTVDGIDLHRCDGVKETR